MGTANQLAVPITFGSLFAGIGGMDLGLERAGMVCRWQVEVNPFCQGILERHWPGVKRYGDITKLDGSELEPVDLICGGFPCQDVSLAGLRKGIGSGTRSGLYADMLRIVCQLRPRFVLVENVSGLLVPADAGEPAPISRVVGDLAESGYDCQWDTFPCAAFGAPHRRDRVFIVAYARGNARLPAKFFSGHGKDLARWWEDSEKWGINRVVVKLGTTTPSGLLIEWREGEGEPEILRVVDGFPGQLDQLKGLGNAVVPQVAEWIGRRIIAASDCGFQRAQAQENPKKKWHE